jgi:hypothetical protein
MGSIWRGGACAHMETRRDHMWFGAHAPFGLGHRRDHTRFGCCCKCNCRWAWWRRHHHAPPRDGGGVWWWCLLLVTWCWRHRHVTGRNDWWWWWWLLLHCNCQWAARTVPGAARTAPAQFYEVCILVLCCQCPCFEVCSGCVCHCIHVHWRRLWCLQCLWRCPRCCGVNGDQTFQVFWRYDALFSRRCSGFKALAIGDAIETCPLWMCHTQTRPYIKLRHGKIAI